MSFFLEGLVLGLGLAFSLGPIFIALTETSIEKGIPAGITVGTGIWVSDLLFISVFYFFMNSIRSTIEAPIFTFWMGISGAIVMAIFGIYLIVKTPIISYSNQKLTAKNYITFGVKGFMVNSINPFTFVFWMSIMSTFIIGREITGQNAFILLSTILVVIIISDSIKVLLAHKLKSKLTPKVANYVFNFSGLVLLGFGLYMLLQVI